MRNTASFLFMRCSSVKSVRSASEEIQMRGESSPEQSAFHCGGTRRSSWPRCRAASRELGSRWANGRARLIGPFSSGRIMSLKINLISARGSPHQYLAHSSMRFGYWRKGRCRRQEHQCVRSARRGAASAASKARRFKCGMLRPGSGLNRAHADPNRRGYLARHL
jgi:hypothetical protein